MKKLLWLICLLTLCAPVIGQEKTLQAVNNLSDLLYLNPLFPNTDYLTEGRTTTGDGAAGIFRFYNGTPAGGTNNNSVFKPTQSAYSGLGYWKLLMSSGGANTTVLVATNVAQLVTFPGGTFMGTNNLICLAGWHTPNGKGSGPFYYDSTDSTTATNLGTVFKSSDGKRLKRVFSGDVNVQWFGAKGDHTTDDSAAITSAMGVVTNGMALFWPYGVYSSSQGFTGAYTSVTWKGEASGYSFQEVGTNVSTLLFTGGTVGLNISGGVATNGFWTLQNLQFDGGGVLSDAVLLSQFALVDNCTFVGCKNAGVHLTNEVDCLMNHISTRNNTNGVGYYGVGVLVDGNSSAWRLKNSSSQGNVNGVMVLQSHGGVVEDCTIEHNLAQGIVITNAIADSVVSRMDFNRVWMEDNCKSNLDFSTVLITSPDATKAADIRFNNCLMDLGAGVSTNALVLITDSTNIILENCIFTGVNTNFIALGTNAINTLIINRRGITLPTATTLASQGIGTTESVRNTPGWWTTNNIPLPIGTMSIGTNGVQGDLTISDLNANHIPIWAYISSSSSYVAEFLNDGGNGSGLDIHAGGFNGTGIPLIVQDYGKTHKYFQVDSHGNGILDVIGGGWQIKEGSDARMGIAVLAAGTNQVANTTVTANTRFFFNYANNTNGAPANVGILYPTLVTPGTNFTIQSSVAADTNIVNWLLIEPSP